MVQARSDWWSTAVLVGEASRQHCCVTLCCFCVSPAADAGMLFSQVGFLYPDGIVMGVANTLSGVVTLNPPPHYR
jgi:hypothetical protein